MLHHKSSINLQAKLSLIISKKDTSKRLEREMPISEKPVPLLQLLLRRVRTVTLMLKKRIYF
jgi:hypothetical protein